VSTSDLRFLTIRKRAKYPVRGVALKRPKQICQILPQESLLGRIQQVGATPRNTLFPSISFNFAAIPATCALYGPRTNFLCVVYH
jgi:hypothetical protein